MDELDDLLARYRPIGPPADLRDRIMSAAEAAAPRVTPARLVEWLPAAAALVLAVLFRWLAANQQQMVDAHFTPVPPIYQSVSAFEDSQR